MASHSPRYPSGPDRTAATGLRLRSIPLVAVMRVSPMAWRSPETNKGMRVRIFDDACNRRSCWARQPSCQYGFGLLVLTVPSTSISAYHSPHLPALQPGGVD